MTNDNPPHISPSARLDRLRQILDEKSGNVRTTGLLRAVEAWPISHNLPPVASKLLTFETSTGPIKLLATEFHAAQMKKGGAYPLLYEKDSGPLASAAGLQASDTPSVNGVLKGLGPAMPSKVRIMTPRKDRPASLENG